MSDLIAGFPPPEEPDDAEIVVLGADGKVPGSAEEAEKKQVTLTSEEFEDLKKQKDSNAALRESIAALGQAVSRPVNTVQQQVVQPAGESDVDFEKRLEGQLFETGKTASAMREAIGRYVGPYFQQALGTIAEQSKKLIEVDPERGPTFKQYRKEIESFVEELPAQQRVNPAVWEHAYETVSKRHSGDLLEERVKAEVEKRLKELGVGAPKEKPAAVGTGQGSTMSSPETTGTKRRAQIILTGDEKSKLERRAEVRGLDLQAFLGTEQGQDELRRLKSGK
jgi:hypothetical protein